MRIKYILQISIGLYVLTLMLFALTNPFSISTPFLLIPFLFLFASLATTLYVLLIVGAHLSGLKLKPRTFLRIAIIGAGFPVTLLVMQSIGGVTLRDILTLIVLFVVLDFYISRTLLREE